VAAASLSLSSLTSGRVTYAGASGLLSDSANFVYDANGNLGIGTSSLNISSGSSGSQVITISASASGRNALLELKGTRTSADQVSSYIRSFSNSATSPGVDFQFYRGATDTDGFLTISTSGTERMRITSDGLVGIGTSSPADKLSVYGDSVDKVAAYVENNNSAGSVGADKRLNLVMGGSSAFGITGWQNAGVIEGTSTGGLWLGAYNGALKFATGSSARTERMRIDSSGNVGIGTSSPSYDLQVSKTVVSGSVITNINNPSATGAARLYLGNDAGESSAYFQVFGSSHAAKPAIINIGGNANYPLVFDTNGTERMRLDTSGNLGLGVTPSANQYGKNLQINQTILNDDNIDSNHLAKNAYYNSGWKYYSTGYASKYTQSLSIHSWSIAASGTAGNAVSFTQAMTLDTNGFLSIGTTSAFARLTTSQSPGSAGQVNGQIAMTHAGASTAYFISTIRGAGTNEPEGLTFKENATERMRIDSSGNVGIGTSSPSAKLNVNGDIWVDAAGATRLKITHTGGGLIQLDNPTEAIRFATLSTERMRIDSSGNVGIGTTSPDIFSNGFERNLGIRIIGDGTTSSINVSGGAASRIQFGVGTTRYGLVYQDASNFMQLGTTTALPISFVTNSTERLRIPADAGGITFPATQVASSNANTLDDYEEGTWTPAIAGDGTTFVGTSYLGRAGKYVKVGDVVWVSFDVEINGVGTQAGNASISGLPFPIPNSSDLSNGGGGLTYTLNMQTNYVYQSCYPQNNSSYLFMIGRTAASTSTTTVASTSFFANAGRIVGWAWYRVTV
jgi:hypothetical protein